jgi:CRP-like cAMP-binding protein
MDTLESAIASHPFWKGAEPAHLAKLAALAQINLYGVGDLIFQERHDADHLYLLHRGHVALEAFLPGTGVTTVSVLGPGEALGWSWLFAPFLWQYSARSVDTTEVIAFRASQLREIADQDPSFGRDLVTRMAQVLLQRMQAERAKLGELHDSQAKRFENVLGEFDEGNEIATDRKV